MPLVGVLTFGSLLLFEHFIGDVLAEAGVLADFVGLLEALLQTDDTSDWDGFATFLTGKDIDLEHLADGGFDDGTDFVDDWTELFTGNRLAGLLATVGELP